MTPPELASNCSANSLWPIRDRLHLWTCTTARNHAVLGHFLEYYAAHGVKVEQNARVVVHRDYAPADALRHVQHVLEGAGVRHIEWLSSVNSTHSASAAISTRVRRHPRVRMRPQQGRRQRIRCSRQPGRFLSPPSNTPTARFSPGHGGP